MQLLGSLCNYLMTLRCCGWLPDKIFKILCVRCDAYETQRINGPRVIPVVYCSFLILKSRNQYYMYDFVTKHYIPPLMGCQPNKMRKEKERT